MSKQTYLKDESREKLMEGINLLADAVGSTLGPSGKTVIIHEIGKEPFITKDGVTVAKSLDHDDPIKNVGILMAKKVSTKMETDSGDGTTTATILLREFLVNGFNLAKQENFDAYLFQVQMEKCLQFTLEQLAKNSVEVTIQDAKRIATISANNDEHIGDLFQTAFDKAGNEGIINIVDSVNGQSFINIIEGYVVDLGYFGRQFANNRQTGFFEATEAHVLIYSKEFTERKQMLDLQRVIATDPKKKPVVVIAKDFGPEAISIAEFNNMDMSSAKICLVKNPMRNEEYDSITQDICVFTGAEPVDLFDAFQKEKFGTAYDLAVKEGYTIFGEPGEGRRGIIETYCDDLSIQAESEVGYRAEQLKKRISKFRNGVITFYVGGNSELELKERRDRVVDAYHAIKAALDKGVIIGGGQSLAIIAEYKLQLDLLQTEKMDPYEKVFFQSIQKPFFQILENSNHSENDAFEILSNLRWNLGYNAKTRKMENLMETGVIDPLKVVIDGLTNAVSIASTIMSTECLLIDKP